MEAARPRRHAMNNKTRIRQSPLIGKEKFDEIHRLFHQRAFVHPDPLEFLYDYPDLHDREVVGLIASSLAYGRVGQILKSTASVLERLGRNPHAFLLGASLEKLLHTFSDFKHRFTTGEELALMLWGARQVFRRYGSFHACFGTVFYHGDDTVLPALSRFVRIIDVSGPECRNSLLPSPDKGSACKRLNLFLRWMVRDDEIDPGGWHKIPASKLIVPLDVHMHRIGRMLHLTTRNQADMRTAIEITEAFRRIAPEDPVRYDFALTRLGIRGEIDPESFLIGISTSQTERKRDKYRRRRT
jgi:uncharacterized protein (TIGR02757 family)